jgi:hypothetical protein
LNINTSVEEFDRWLSLLPSPPWLIPLQRYEKAPDVPAGESWKDLKYKLTVEQARERLMQGLNVGVVAVGDIVIWDHDEPEKFLFPAETLTVVTRSGKLHKYFINGGDVKNADGKGRYRGCGEIRAEWKYVAAPGSYVPPDEPSPEATGLYRVVKPIPPAVLHSRDIPPEFRPGFDDSADVPIEPKPHPAEGWDAHVNRLGYTLSEIRARDRVLDEYLRGGLAGKPSDSEADMGTLQRLLFWGYDPDEAVGILEQYRWREKLKRRDYIEGMLKKLLPVNETAEPKPRPAPPACEISETFTYTGDRTFRGRVQVGALTTPLSRFMRLRFKCKDPGECKVDDCPLRRGLTLSVDDARRFDPSAFATYFDTDMPLDALSVYAERRSFSRCAEWRKKVIYRGRGERAVTGALIYDLTGREGRAWFIHGERCDLSRAPNWIIAEGWLCRGYRGRIGVLITAFISESEVIAPPPEEVEKARGILRATVINPNGLEGSGVWRLAELLRRKVNAKGNEVCKGFVGDLLTVASPVWVKTPESGDRELGATTCELGPSTNYKSQRARFLVGWLEAGKYLRGRKTEAGLTAGLEKVEGLGWVAKKGALPSADLSYIILDNAHPHALDEQIESRRDGIVSMTGIKVMEIWARTRLKLLNNPLQPFDELPYRCVGLKMFDSKLIARMAFAIYTYGVSAEERYDPSFAPPAPEDEAMIEAAKTVLRWNLSHETTYTVPLHLWPKIMDYSKKLELKYGCEDIPLLLRNIPYKMAVLAYSFALLEGEAEPSERHYTLAYEWLDYCARDIELDKYAEVQRALRNLSDEEYAKIRGAIEQEIADDVEEHGGERKDSTLYRFLDYLIRHGTARCDELAAYLELDSRTVMRKAQLFKGLGLLRSGKDGYSYTPKGVRFVKRWLVTDVADATPSEGDRRDMEKPEKQIISEEKHEKKPSNEKNVKKGFSEKIPKAPQSPQGGDISDIYDTTRPTLADSLKRLRVVMVHGATYWTSEVAELAKWTREYAEEVLRVGLRDGIVFQPAPDRWMLSS